jgi:hypothetical protein
MITENQKIRMLAFVAIVAVFAFAISPITTAFAQESTNSIQVDADEKTYEGKEGKSCAGKDKRSMST